MIAESARSLRAMCSALINKNEVLLVQELIKGSLSDYRVLVFGGKVVAAICRRPQSDEFRANVHQGGQAVAVEANNQLAELALRATEAMKLEIAGVDILQGDGSPVVLEVNGAPSFSGLQKVYDFSIADKMIDCFENFVSSFNSKNLG